MQSRIEPPILLSRLLTLVFAATLVVLAVMAVTVYKMFPLDRPEVFFLRTSYSTDTAVTLTRVMPAGGDLDSYRRAFIAEYIKTRNIFGRIRTIFAYVFAQTFYKKCNFAAGTSGTPSPAAL